MRTRRAVPPKGVKLEHTGVAHKDMDFGNLAEATRDRILAGFRVSKKNRDQHIETLLVRRAY
jgi:hypothetical protein